MDSTRKQQGSYGEMQQDLSIDTHSPYGIETRARRAFLAGQQVGMVFDCPNELVIQCLARQIRSRLSQ